MPSNAALMEWLTDFRERMRQPLDSDQILALATEAEERGYNRGHVVFYIMQAQKEIA